MNIHFPDHFPADDDLELPYEPLTLRKITKAEMAFPANVSPDWELSPPHLWEGVVGSYQNGDNPWIRLSLGILHDRWMPSLLPRAEDTDSQAVWDWVVACARSYELKHQYKIVVIAWILESFFCAYWNPENPPQWVQDWIAASEGEE